MKQGLDLQDQVKEQEEIVVAVGLFACPRVRMRDSTESSTDARTSMIARLHTHACVRGGQCEKYCTDILSLVDKNVVDVETERFSGDAAVHSVGTCVHCFPYIQCHLCARVSIA